MRPEENVTHLARALEDYLAGVEGAADRLCALLQPRLLPIARSFGGAGSWDAEDVVNVSLLAILNFLAERGWYESGRGAFIAFCSKVVRNRCIDMQRREARRPSGSTEPGEIADPAGFMDPLIGVIAAETRRNLRRSLAQLDPECRELVINIYYHRRSMEKLREAQGLRSVQALYYRRDKCLAKLRKIFKRLEQPRS
jgi:RNA polymerase sigma factor (sigma-70 family)